MPLLWKQRKGAKDLHHWQSFSTIEEFSLTYLHFALFGWDLFLLFFLHCTVYSWLSHIFSSFEDWYAK